MQRPSKILAVGLVAMLCSLAAAAPAPPENLTLEDLINHPERWPAAVTMTTDLRLRSGQVIRKGQKVRVHEVVAKGVLADAGTGVTFGVPVAGSDVLDAANEKWSKLTPGQRAIDEATVLGDASLWPDTVKTRKAVKIDGPLGLSKVLPPGSALILACYDEQGVYLKPPDLDAHVNLKFVGTDLIDAARERALIEPAKRPSRLIEGVRNVMVDASGKPFANPSLDQTKVFVFYYGANWCGFCHQFSPTLVKFVNDNAAGNPHMTVIMLDGDEKDAAMLAYMKDEKMPWPAIRMADWKKVPVFAAIQREAWPQLLITDRYGKVIYNEVGGGPSDIKLHTEALKKLNDGGAAR